MKATLSFLFLFISTLLFSQHSEELVPEEAISVFSVIDIDLLERISLDDLANYEFMEEVQQEIFDGSTAGKTIKDSGIDFEQKLNVFNGKGYNYTINGFSFGIADKDALFETFDDFTPVESNYDGVEMYVSYFNRIVIKGESGVLFRVTPLLSVVNNMTDSIWYARGNSYPWQETELQELFDELEGAQEDTYEITDDMETSENTNNPVDSELPYASENPDQKNYYELRDSVDLALQNEYLDIFCTNLFVQNNNLYKKDERFREQLTHSSAGVFYSDNARSLAKDSEFSALKLMYPGLVVEVQELFSDNLMLGDLQLGDGEVTFNVDLKYGNELGSIYKELSVAKFDKNILKYIHKDNSAYFMYNVNMREAYEQTFNILQPLMEASDNQNVTVDLLILELFNEFMNKDALFDTYKGSMFGTYSDVKKIKTKKIVFDYDEETFEYLEKEVEAEEDMPVFTLGFSTDRTDIAELIMKRSTKISSRIKKEDDYWIYENAVLGAAPLYMIAKNDLFILTNDPDLAKNNSDGYGANALGKTSVKKAKKSGTLYGYADLGKAVESLPRELFTERDNEILDVVRGKEGSLEIVSSETTSEKTSFKLSYRFDGAMKENDTYILDLINSMYVIFK